MKKEFDFDDIGGASSVDNRFCGYCHSCGIGRLFVYAVSFQGR